MFRLKPFSFVWIIGGCGVFLLLAILGNLWVLGLHRYPAGSRWYVKDADPERGRTAIETHGCGGCHSIPGINNATGRVGPRLEGIGEQIYLAGVLPNTPENMISWIMNPHKSSPQTAMPNLGITRAEAGDIAAYLYSVSGAPYQLTRE
jgi:cytochrome c2